MLAIFSSALAKIFYLQVLMKKINNLCWCYFHLWWQKYHLCWLYIHLRWQFFLSTSTGENIICIGVIIICGGENIICVGGKLCILFLSALAKISSALAIFSSVLAKISCALAKISCALAEISCALAEISCALAKISCVVVVFSSVLVGNYVHCKSPTQIFPTKTSPLLALILFRRKPPSESDSISRTYTANQFSHTCNL